MNNTLEDFGLKRNPFEPSASGAPVTDKALWMPASWSGPIRDLISAHSTGRSASAMAISGEYGSGKSYVLQWLHRDVFPALGVRSFYFDNPGVRFYDLANTLLRQIGRKDFCKALWELASTEAVPSQLSLFSTGYEDYLRSFVGKRDRAMVTNALGEAIRKAGITDDEEIATRLAILVAETPGKPYFEYKDFVAGRPGALVAEREEPRFFASIIRTIVSTGAYGGVAFLLDEFEEVAYAKHMTRRDAQDYLGTLKRLINLAETENLWVVLAMTNLGVETTKELDPALWERFVGLQGGSVELTPVAKNDAETLIAERLKLGRLDGFDPPHRLFPFPEGFPGALKPISMLPRRLVQICFLAIGEAVRASIPITFELIHEMENRRLPDANQETRNA